VILVVSHPADDHAVGVLAVLDRGGHPSVLVDTSQFPSNAALTERFGAGAPSYDLVVGSSRVDLAACRVAWWRRPQPFTLHAGIAPESASFTYTECHEAVAGLWASLDLTWVNPPGLDEMAHHKPYQLAVATEVGLPIPRTVITNDPAEARRFADELGPGRTVYKTFLASEDHWRETRLLHVGELAMLDRVRLAPVIFQELVPALADVRVTVLGQRLFATSISASPGGYELDYRMDLAGASFAPTEVPVETQEGIHALMQRLGLVYGAVDLRRTHDGEHIFLEINPAGEWLFVEERTGQPITEAMAELLIELDRS
jgi:glutathione synthase/RimK-type ligase-like ATP-grasp enzyme